MSIVKKILVILFVVAILCSAVACSEDTDTSKQDKTENDSGDTEASIESENADPALEELIRGHWRGEVDQTESTFAAIVYYLSHGKATTEEILAMYEHLDATTAMPVIMSFSEDTARLKVSTSWIKDLESFVQHADRAVNEYYISLASQYPVDDERAPSDWLSGYVMGIPPKAKEVLEKTGFTEENIDAMTVKGEYSIEDGKLIFNGESESISIDGDTMILDGVTLQRYP